MTQPDSPVLVVDDDSRSRELLALVLRHAGFVVLAARHSSEAMSLLATERPALALVDYLMPGMNGLDLCRWIRLQPDHAGMRFVLLTGMDSLETRAEAQAAGADIVVTKPFDRLELLARLKALLEQPTAR